MFYDHRLGQSPAGLSGCRADYALRGGVQGAFPTSLNLQLINVASGVCLWADTRALGRHRDVTDDLAREISTVLVKDVGQRVDAVSATDLTPQELILRGRAWLLRPSVPTNRRALCCFKRVLDMDPDSTGAKHGIATALIGQLANGWSRTIGQDEARVGSLLLDVFQAGRDLPVAHSIHGTLRRLQGRLDESRIELEIATDLAPHIGMAQSQLGMTLLYCGMPEAARVQFEAGVRKAAFDPQKPLLLTNLGIGYLTLGDVDKAIDTLREATASSPYHSVPLLNLAAALGLRSSLAEARDALQRAVEQSPAWRTLSEMRNWVRRQAKPDFMPMYENALERGLRQAGMPET